MDPNHFLMLILLRFELFDYFNGNCSGKDQVSYTLVMIKCTPSYINMAPNTLVVETWIILQDELIQWNRLTEEMLYLLIVIVGNDTIL